MIDIDAARGQSIVVLTGAGISKESGLSTFRDPGGIWSTVQIEDVATPDAFARDPSAVQGFYNWRRRNLVSSDVQANAAHRALADLESFWPADFLLVTQNIDHLHEAGGSRNLLHMHGELLKSRCVICGDLAECLGDLGPDASCGECDGTGTLRPHVVWFGETPLELERIYGALSRCGLFVSIGTSGDVYPAAGFVEAARAAGAQAIELNLEPSEGADSFPHAEYGPATEIVPHFVELLRAG
jgi:NAD-dependent deacetylase